MRTPSPCEERNSCGPILIRWKIACVAFFQVPHRFFHLPSFTKSKRSDTYPCQNASSRQQRAVCALSGKKMFGRTSATAQILPRIVDGNGTGSAGSFLATLAFGEIASSSCCLILYSTKRPVTCGWPHRLAICNGVRMFTSFLATRAPAFSKTSHASCDPNLAAS